MLKFNFLICCLTAVILPSLNVNSDGVSSSMVQASAQPQNYCDVPMDCDSGCCLHNECRDKMHECQNWYDDCVKKLRDPPSCWEHLGHSQKARDKKQQKMKLKKIKEIEDL